MKHEKNKQTQNLKKKKNYKLLSHNFVEFKTFSMIYLGSTAKFLSSLTFDHVNRPVAGMLQHNFFSLCENRKVQEKYVTNQLRHTTTQYFFGMPDSKWFWKNMLQTLPNYTYVHLYLYIHTNVY